MHKFTGETVDIDRDVMATLRSRGGSWAVYQNVDMSSIDLGRLTFLKFGKGCTFGEPPEKAPDGPHGAGWRYYHVGILNEGKTAMVGADGQEFKVVEREPEPEPPIRKRRRGVPKEGRR